MAEEKLTGIVDELCVYKTAKQVEMAFFNLSGNKMVVFPMAYQKYKTLITDGANLMIYADRNRDPGRDEYIVRDVHLNEE